METGFGEGRNRKPCEFCRDWIGCKAPEELDLPPCP